MPSGDEGQRKLAAILAADVAGYSRLMADDDRATVRTLTAYREIFAEHIEGHQGRVVDTAGDSVLATFESVIEAVEAAIEIQRALAARNEALPDHRKMHFRIGVNLGDIIVRDDGTVYGDGVNVAARLEGLAEPGGVMVSESAHLHVEDRLGVGLEFVGAHEVKNIAKPVKSYRVLLGGSGAGASAVMASAGKKSRRLKMLAGLVGALAALIGLAVWGLTVRIEGPQMVKADGTPTEDPVLAVSNGPSIVVVPFENLSGDSEQDIFALGLSREIVADLSRFTELFVFALDAARHLRSEGKSPSDVGHTLGARYVLSGSVARAQESLRISATLTDAVDKSVVWAETYDRDLTVAGLFDIQDDIAATVSAKLVGAASVITRVATEEALRKRPDDLRNYECVLMEFAYWDIYTEDWHLKTRTCLERAVADNPTYAPAWVSLSRMISEEYLTGYNTGDRPMGRALEAARAAVNLDQSSSLAYTALADMHYFVGDYEEFLIAAKRALALNPNNVETLANFALRYAQMDMPERSEALLEKTRRLNPYPPSWIYWADLHIAASRGDHEARLEAAQKVFVDGFFLSHGALAIAYINLGRDAEARAAVEAMLATPPGYTPEDIEQSLGDYIGSERLRALAMDALYRAGMKRDDLTN